MLGMVEFRPEEYGPDIARILALAGGGKRPMPLVKTASISPEVCDAVEGLDSLDVCEAVMALDSLPALVRSGLYLYCGCWMTATRRRTASRTPAATARHRALPGTRSR